MSLYMAEDCLLLILNVGKIIDEGVVFDVRCMIVESSQSKNELSKTLQINGRNFKA